MMAGEEEYRVGYGKPPRETQFRKGRSGNPRGRPKGVANLKTDLAAELTERVTITEGGKRKRMSKQRLLLKAQFQRAMKGDTRAATALLALVIKAFGTEGESRPPETLPPSDEAIIQAYLERLRQAEERS